MKKLVLLIIFCLFFLPRPVQATSRVPILMYHYIGNNPNPKDLARDALSVSPDKFTAQMQWLRDRGYTPITLDTLYSRNYPAKPVVLTFDDGYMDFYYNAYPILKSFGYHAVAFIPTGLMNQGYYLTWDQIRQMRDLVSFESHSVTHRNLALFWGKSLQDEVVNSKAVLQAQTGQIVNFIAYPGGAYNWQTIQAVQKAGYVAGVGTWERTRMNNWTDYRRLIP